MKNGHVVLAIVGAALFGLFAGRLGTWEPPPSDEAAMERIRAAAAMADQSPEGAAERIRARAEAASRARTAEAPAPAPQAGSSRPDRPRPTARALVEIFPEDATRGPPNAPVTVVEFTDFLCRGCAQTKGHLDRLVQEHGRELRLVFKHVPSSRRSPVVHMAAIEAHAQGRFWPFHDLIFRNTRATSDADLEAHAAALGLDVARFRTAMRGGVHQAILQRDEEQARALGVNTVPTYFVNGRMLAGPQSYEALKEAIETELGRR